METRAHYVAVGLFAVISVCAALLFGLWLTKSGSDKQYKNYDIVFNEAVSGLTQGSAVQYSGIKVGDVIQLELDPKNPNKVWARVRISSSTPIREDVHAKLTSAGITGTSMIQLSSTNESSPLIVTKGNDVPVIVAEPSAFSQLKAGGEDLMTNLINISSNLDDLTSPDNIKHINKTLSNLDQVTGLVVDERENIKTIVKELAQASRNMNETLTQTTKLTKNANDVMGTQGKQLMVDATKTMASLERASTSIDKLLKENGGSINEGVQGLKEIEPTLNELRKSLISLRNITNRMEEDPAGYIFGQEKTKEFTPK